MFWVYVVRKTKTHSVIGWPQTHGASSVSFHFYMNLTKWYLRSPYLTDCSETLAFPFTAANLINDK